MARKKLVLVISRDAHLADVRYHVLVGAGYDVISTTNIRGVVAGCAAHPDGAMICYSLPAAEKRRTWAELKKCRIPVLELHEDNPPVLLGATHHHARTPEDFLKAFNGLLGGKPARKAARKSAGG